NGLGGYASGTVSGALTRRFHGILIAALPSPHGRTMMLNDLIECVVLLDHPDQSQVTLGAQERADTGMRMNGALHLSEFRMEWGLPVWRYEIGGTVIEKRVMLPNGQNTSLVTYKMIAGDGRVCLELRPAVQMRPHEGKLGEPWHYPYELSVTEDRYELSSSHAHLPPLRLTMHHTHPAFTFDREWVRGLTYDIERARGYDYKGDLWSPGYFRVELVSGQSATLIASTESWEIVEALLPEEAFALEHERRRRLVARGGGAEIDATAAELVLAADQFIITPAGRVRDQTRARAAGDEVRTVIAGYHWFTDWGRDTMISLEGLTLATNRTVQARYILRTFAHYIRDGLIPNMFPEGETAGLYHTADATLWFFHAIDRYVAATSDRVTLANLLPKLLDIIEHHLRGTRFNIHVDPNDGLLAQGAEGYQLTWMDAKVDGWVVTPRRGKAVEINALWYNALRLLEGWLNDAGRGDDARRINAHAERARESFNKRFWYEQGGYLFDVIEGEAGDDAACRPNQIFAISLTHAVLDPSRWPAVIEVVRARLLTPMGLRSLAPGEKDYKARYDGDLRSRDAAYHQGTVWAWLIGPFVDAWLKLHPEDKAGARQFLEGLVPHLSEACIGSVSEIFDAETPFTPRGCAAQAWSVAELLRCWLKTMSGA
ncbi:MAG TPA: amylo-alpha-1,6-glucosidase, partial [Blastocatellia bacterium]|nr:amylo-alpha-1,6-glucosidase [Blastocatellia bacterium]